MLNLVFFTSSSWHIKKQGNKNARWCLTSIVASEVRALHKWDSHASNGFFSFFREPYESSARNWTLLAYDQGWMGSLWYGESLITAMGCEILLRWVRARSCGSYRRCRVAVLWCARKLIGDPFFFRGLFFFFLLSHLRYHTRVARSELRFFS